MKENVCVEELCLLIIIFKNISKFTVLSAKELTILSIDMHVHYIVHY